MNNGNVDIERMDWIERLTNVIVLLNQNQCKYGQLESANSEFLILLIQLPKNLLMFFHLEPNNPTQFAGA